ncbi:c-type cytochrome [Varunaivibrio sulfuroxidans]|uniref:Cytochrome c n=1 Tax=Varunaivibrio sulfuroxidans TaxID=1773489 RepID=A0A4R3JD58_9PROT|nr:c-type cytochrome [Varunaivibrio sulfuroxidans]TCS62630.1 cytochrome c [Varunaivibrio sulfuroxidans]WES30703.1 c-type cytochrome [Varunaivibrio sulfuroxidans]
MKASRILALGLATTFALGVGSAQAASSAGEKLFQRKCSTCHKLDKNAVGPELTGIIGRKAGSVADFKRYKAMKGAKFTWDEKLLDEWIANPRKFLKEHADIVGGKSTSMVVKIKKEKERQAIIDYLKTAK